MESNSPGLFPTYISTNAPLEIGDELWLYYTEANGAHPIAPFEKAVSQIRAAVWRRDGFVSLDANEHATLTTKPIAVDANGLMLNVKTALGGSVRVAILDEPAAELPGFRLDQCDPICGDHVRAVVTWQGHADTSSLAGRTVRLRFTLSRSKLFSFRASRD